MQKGKGDFMSKRKWLAGFSAAVLLVTTLAVGLVFQASAAITGGTMTPLTTQAEVDALGTSLIAGKTAQLKTGAQFMDGYGPEYMTDGGIAALKSDAPAARIQWDNFDSGKTAATVYLWFDMGSVQTVNRLLICSIMANPYQLYNGQVFVGNAVDTLFADDTKVLSYDYGASGAWVEVATNGREVRPIMQFDLLENCQGRYIGFAFYKPYFGDMDWTNMEAGITVSELGVYYDPSINARASLIAGKEPVAVTTTQTDATNQAQVTGLTEIENGANLTDGSAETGSLYLPGCYPFDYNANPHKCGQVRFYFDMGASYTVDQIDLTSAGPQHSYVYEGTVYVADSAESLFADANAAASFHKGYNGNTEKTLTLSAYKTGRYVGFALYSPAAYQTNWDNFWSGRVVLEEIGVYGEEPVSSLLTGKQPILASTTRTDAQTQGQVSGLTELEGDGAGLTDNNTSSGASLYLPGCSPFDYNAHAHQTGDVRVYFDLGETYRLNKAGIVSLADVQKYYIYRGSIYVGNRADTLFTEDNRAASFNYGYNGASKELAVDMNATGRYVGFSLYAPAAWETNWDNFWSGRVQIGELSVYGERPTEIVEPSLITGKQPIAASTTRIDAQTQAQVSGLTEMADDGAGLTDNTAAGTALYLPGCSPFNYDANAHYTGDARVYFDLGDTYQLNKATIVSQGDKQRYYIFKASGYVSDDADSLFNSGNKVAEFRSAFNSNSEKTIPLDMLSRVATGRYVGFSLYAPAAWECSWDQWWAGQVLVEELAVYGEKASGSSDTNLISGMKPVDSYLTNRLYPDRYHEGNSNGFLNELVISYPERLTDGDRGTRASWTHQRTDGRIPTLEDRKLISMDTPWAVVIYHLGGTAEVTDILLTSTGEPGCAEGNYYIAGVDYYVGMTLDTLFDASNRVFTTNGEKTIEKNGEEVLDPSVDVLDRYIYSGELSTPKQGRYVALVVTRPDATPVPGWSEARVNEFEVFGTLKSRDETVTTSFSESTYGCTLTLSQLNYDDVDFFKNLSRLEVKRTAIASGVNQTVDKWLKADPKAQYVYTFTLYDKSGKAIHANDVGKRKITVTIPNQSGQALTLAQLNGSTLTRIVNAHVHKGKLLGENITGNWQFVPVVFETKDVIYNGIGAR